MVYVLMSNKKLANFQSKENPRENLLKYTRKFKERFFNFYRKDTKSIKKVALMK